MIFKDCDEKESILSIVLSFLTGYECTLIFDRLMYLFMVCLDGFSRP